jgi:peptide subunit release factor 1 (eRF1)
MAETSASPKGLVTASLAPARLRELAEVQPAEGRVLSVYMDLDPAEFGTAPARATQVTSLMTDARRTIDELDDLSHDERKALRADLETVRETLSQPGIADNGARAVAVFACSPAGLLEVVRTPRPLPPKVVVDRAPHVEPLVLAQGAERWCVLLANRRNARLFTGAPSELEETDRVEDNVHSQHRQGGWSYPRYERSIEEDVRDHLENVARVTFDLLKARRFERLLIGAPQETVGDLERHLHPYLKERLAGQVKLDVENSSAEDVRRATAEKVAELEARREEEALERLRQGIGSGGRAAAGRDEVLRLLEEARVEALLLADGTEAGEAIERALETGAEVLIFRHHAEHLGPHGGIAALLRY